MNLANPHCSGFGVHDKNHSKRFVNSVPGYSELKHLSNIYQPNGTVKNR
jgi:hypothetical protein